MAGVIGRTGLGRFLGGGGAEVFGLINGLGGNCRWRGGGTERTGTLPVFAAVGAGLGRLGRRSRCGRCRAGA